MVEFEIGNKVELQTTLGHVVGIVFAFDKSSGVLVLKETGSHSGVSNVRIMKAAEVKKVISSEKPAQPFDTFLPHVDTERCRRREDKAVQQAELEASRVGVGVSKEAQAVFDALIKTMPCHWRGKTIVVLDCVFVDEPYTVEACRADANHQSTLERVRKVLGAERDRLAI